MKIKDIIIFFTLFTIAQYTLGQCNDGLIEKAISESGNDALLLRKFKIKLPKGTPRKPVPVAKYTLKLNKGIKYRFNLVNAEKNSSEAISQLWYKNNLLVSSYNFETNIDLQQFDYYCDRTATYQMAVSFKEGKKGCAAGVLSMVVTDSTRAADLSNTNAIDSLEVLYIGVDNPISIAASGVPDGTLEVSISKGIISGHNGEYTIVVNESGIVDIKVIARDKNGDINETAIMSFQVQEVPNPDITINGTKGGVINKDVLLHSERLELHSRIDHIDTHFEIIEFILSDEKTSNNGYRSNGAYFSLQQKRWLQSQTSGTKIYIKNIILKLNNDERKVTQPLEFIIE